MGVTSHYRVICAGPRGNDPAAGTPQDPLTIKRAIELLRDRRDEPAELQLLDGTYLLDGPLILTAAESGAPGRPVRVAAAPGAQPVLSLGRPVDGWRRIDHPLDGLPPEACSGLWYTDLPSDSLRDGPPRALFDADGMIERARYGPLTTDPERNADATPTRLCARQGDLRRWDRLAPELFIIPSHVWQAQYLPVSRADPDSATLETATAGTYPLVADGRGAPSLRYWIENVPEGLSGPGRWLVTPSGRIYLWPRGNEPGLVLRPMGVEAMRLEPDADGRAAHDIEIEGLTFARGDRPAWPKARRAPQHDWQVYGWSDALMRLSGARDVVVRNCRFVESGGTGIRLDGFSVGNTVERCSFERLGSNAIAIVGDEPGRPERVHNNTISRNRIRDTGLLWWQASGIIVVQSGHNRIADNHLSELPYGAVTLVSGREAAFTENRPEDGRDGNVITADSFGASPHDFLFVVGHLACRNNVVEHNEIHDVMRRLGDGNAIYLSGTGWGNVVRGNYVHDITAVGTHSGIRTDDRQWYTLVERNVVCRVNGGGLTLKDVNDMVDNVIVDCARPAAILIRRSPAWGANVKRNIIVVREPTGTPPGPFFGDGGFGGRIEEPNIDDNVLWCASDPLFAQACIDAMRAVGRNLNAIAADPRFADAAGDDYRLAGDSPALEIGIRSLDTWGVRPETSG